MKLTSENLRYILGLKLNQVRQGKKLSLKELADKTNLSISYLSEIEKGKKYPKPEKIIAIAEALDISFESLVSLKVDENLNPLKDFMDTPFMREFPFDLFGISQHDVLNLLTESPQKANAFIRTIWDVGHLYDMKVEQFLFAALRSYQKMNLNYFPEIEESAKKFIDENNCDISQSLKKEKFEEILKTKYGYVIDEETLGNHPSLCSFRSIYVNSHPQRLLINKKLLPSQKAFILARELGYRYLSLKEREQTSAWIKVESFDQVLNNFKASYFAGALLINEKSIINDLKTFFNEPKWNGKNFLAIMNKYDATPEMFIYRIGHIIPKFFGLEEVHYLRFNNKTGSNNFRLVKELNMSPVIAPRSIGLNEHYCRRWLSINLLNKLTEKQKKGSYKETMIAAQRAKFIESDASFFTISLARRLVLNPDTNSSMIIGFLINDNFKKKVKFWNDSAIKDTLINETCERCGLTEKECSDRAAPPIIYEQKKKQKNMQDALEDLLNEFK